MTRSLARLALLALLALGSCKRLATGAKEEFGEKLSCPVDRVVVKGRSDLKYGDLVIAQRTAELPPEEIGKDPQRLAKWQNDRRKAQEKQQRDLNGLAMFEVSGCDHTLLLGCRHPSHDGNSIATHEVECFELPAASHPK